jgi:D-alanyl-D-alanine carboxypeptidase/D-alanyl-D-alanine-endopeptidase (penicillin-binding protein 4)
MRLADGAILASGRPERPMQPASVQKLCTTAVALETLGDNFQFITTVGLLGHDLVVVGDGDPMLGDPVVARASGGTIYDALDSWAAALKARGVMELNDLVLDNTFFTQGRPADWPANQRGHWYCAPVDILVHLENGHPAAELQPQSQLIQVDNRLSGGARHLWHVAVSDDVSTVRLTGSIRLSSRQAPSPINVAVDNPTVLLGRVLADRLARAGITLKGQIVVHPVLAPDRSLPAGLVVIAKQASPLTVALARMNKNSLNLAAECVFLRAAADPAAPEAFASAAKNAAAVLVEKYHLPADQFALVDGCGLSHKNRLSPLAMAMLLRHLARSGHAPVFLPTLAIAGVDGSLSKRLGACSGRFIGKTGTVAGVSTLAGYVLDGRGRPVVAAAIFCGDPPGGRDQARQVQDAMITRWIVQFGQVSE